MEKNYKEGRRRKSNQTEVWTALEPSTTTAVAELSPEALSCKFMFNYFKLFPSSGAFSKFREEKIINSNSLDY